MAYPIYGRPPNPPRIILKISLRPEDPAMHLRKTAPAARGTSPDGANAMQTFPRDNPAIFCQLGRLSKSIFLGLEASQMPLHSRPSKEGAPRSRHFGKLL